jgi:hypothetical protein
LYGSVFTDSEFFAFFLSFSWDFSGGFYINFFYDATLGIYLVLEIADLCETAPGSCLTY